jgi:hypothetical protein
MGGCRRAVRSKSCHTVMIRRKLTLGWNPYISHLIYLDHKQARAKIKPAG